MNPTAATTPFTVTQPASPVIPTIPASVAPSLNPFGQQTQPAVSTSPTPAQSTQPQQGLTTAQLAAKYGVPPTSIPSAVPSSSSGGLTTAQLAAKYGVDPTTIPSTTSNNITPGTSGIAKAANAFVPIGSDIGQGIANPANKALYQQAVAQTNGTAARIQAQINADQAAGKDTSRLQNALNLLQQSAPQESDFTGTEKTGEQVLGDAVSSALNIAGTVELAGLVPSAAIGGAAAEGAGGAATAAPDFITDEAGNTTATGADNSPLGPKAKAPLFTGADTTAPQTMSQRLFQGAKVGAGFGAATGAANAMQNNGNFGQVVGGAAEGAVPGAIGGAVLEGIASKVAPSLFSSPLADSSAKSPLFNGSANIASKNIQQAIDDASDPIDKAALEEAKRNALPTNSTVTKSGLFTPSAVANTPDDIARGTTAAPYISGVKDPFAKVANLNQGILDRSNALNSFMDTQSAPANFEDIHNYIQDNMNPTPTLKKDPQAYPAYQRIANKLSDITANALRDAASQSGDFSENTSVAPIRQARIAFDQAVQDENTKNPFASPQYYGVKAAEINGRNMLNGLQENMVRYPGQLEQLNQYNEAIRTLNNKGITVDPAQLKSHVQPDSASWQD